MFTDFFPYECIRDEQKKIIDNIEVNFDTYKNFIIEAPTGTGKSAIAYTLMKNVNRALVLTSTKYLQNQYEQEFTDILSVKGRGAYPCTLVNKSCEKAPCRTNIKVYSECHKNCEYMQNLDKIPKAKLTVTNYASFLTNNIFKTQHYDVIILDECHLVESNILNMLGSVINIDKLNEQYDIFEGVDIGDMAQCFSFQSGYAKNKQALDTLKKLLNDRIKKYDVEMHNANENQKLTLQDLKEDLTKILTKLNSFLNAKDKENWVCEPTNDTLYIQPINIGDAFYKMFAQHADKLILMSATILNAKSYIKDLGLNPEVTKCLRVSSSFDPKLAPIISIPCGKMNYANINKSMPQVIKTIKDILDKHKGQKGIIHTNSYKITEEIIKQVNDKRLLHKNSESKFYSLNNEELLKLHENSKEDTVLISPSLNTGADLKDDLSRFQIIVKLPFASLSDKRVAKKMSIDPAWYTAEMLRTLIQMSGRSIRHDKDYCVTYVLDSSFMYYIRSNKNLFTQQFLKRIYSDINNWNEEEYNKLVQRVNHPRPKEVGA